MITEATPAEILAVEKLPPVPHRRTFIGGSDIAALAGLTRTDPQAEPWKTPFDVWLEKTGRAPAEITPSTYLGRQPKLWGKVHERTIMSIFEAHLGRTFVHLFDEPIVSADRPWQGGSPDAVDFALGEVADAKNVGERAEGFGEDNTDEMPDAYAAQLLWYMSLMNYDVGWLPVLIGGQDFHVYRLERDADVEARLLEIGHDFWFNHVQADIPPPIGASTERTKAFLASLHHGEQIREATDEEFETAIRLAVVKQMAAKIESREELLANRLRLAIGTDAGLSRGGVRVTWKAPKDSEKVDYQAVAVEALTTLQLLSAAAPGVTLENVQEIARTYLADDPIRRYTALKPNARRLLVNVQKRLLPKEEEIHVPEVPQLTEG